MAAANIEIVEVVAAVITRPDGSFLMADRPLEKVYAGYWEFPGGKVEAGESLGEALRRELREELGIVVDVAQPWVTRMHVYSHATVRLHFFRVTGWRGEPHPHEGQRISWCRPDEAPLQPMLPANTAIFRALRLPSRYAITHAEELGVAAFLRRLDTALVAGLRLVQVREKMLPAADLERFAREVAARCREHGARVLVNSDLSLVGRVAADGVHLTAAQLRAFATRPECPLVGASCHDAGELELAAALGADFAVLGPVQATKTHPDAALLGWERFRTLATDRPMPVYALGGLRPTDLARALDCGAHGIALQRAAW